MEQEFNLYQSVYDNIDKFRNFLTKNVLCAEEAIAYDMDSDPFYDGLHEGRLRSYKNALKKFEELF